MKLLGQFVFIFIISYIFELFLPWWSIAIAAFVGGITLRTKINFLIGFLAVACLWLTKAWFISSHDVNSLTEKVAHIFTLNSKASLFTLMALLGGLVGGFACLTGALVRRNWMKA